MQVSRRKHACDSAKTHSCLGEDKVVFRRRHGGKVCLKIHEVHLIFHEACVKFRKGCVRFYKDCVRLSHVRILFNMVREGSCKTMLTLRQVYMIQYDIPMISLPFLQFVCKMQQIVRSM